MAMYASTTDLANLGLPAEALSGVSLTVQEAHLTKASGKIDSYLRSRHSLPLGAPYPDEVIDCCVSLAAYTLLVRRGFNPDEYDSNFRQQYDDALEWLRDLAAGRASLADTADATATTAEGAPRVTSGGANRIHGDGDAGEGRGW